MQVLLISTANNAKSRTASLPVSILGERHQSHHGQGRRAHVQRPQDSRNWMHLSLVPGRSSVQRTQYSFAKLKFISRCRSSIDDITGPGVTVSEHVVQICVPEIFRILMCPASIPLRVHTASNSTLTPLKKGLSV